MIMNRILWKATFGLDASGFVWHARYGRREIHKVQSAARSAPENAERPRWPMIVFCTPKGWTGLKFVDGKPVEGTWRAHQVAIADFKNPEHVHQLEDWMKSYRPHELFDDYGKFREELAALAPTGRRRMGMNPHVVLNNLDRY
jgi:xylulose-5-phosphate/fructose-6-phosphate phosphoketolase